MEKFFRYLFLTVAGFPTLFMALAWVMHRRLQAGWPGGLSLQPDPAVMNQLAWPLRFSHLLLYLLPVGFFLMLVSSLVSYAAYRKQLPLRHFNLQTICYLPYLVFVILLRYPSYNPVNWLVYYLT